MGSSPKVGKPAPVPPEPEPVKYTDAEAARSRNKAKAAASRRFGVSATDVTKGTLGDDNVSTKKRTLGGV
jgi:hypothetical protein